MILSKLHNFIFIKGSKVAGTSVEIALSAICGDDDIITPFVAIDEQARINAGGRPAQNYSRNKEIESEFIRQVREASEDNIADIDRPGGRFTNHMTFNAVEKRVGDVSNYFVFGVDRNPYAKVISRANMKSSFNQYRTGGKEMVAKEDKLEKHIDWVLSRGAHRVMNLPRYLDRQGNLRAQVLRYENLAEEFAALVERQGWQNVPPLPHVKKGIMSNERDYREVLSPAQIEQINTLFDDEFRAYGYEKL